MVIVNLSGAYVKLRSMSSNFTSIFTWCLFLIHNVANNRLAKDAERSGAASASLG